MLLAACDSFDEEDAALQIRQEFCEGWPFGCTDSTFVRIEGVNETPNGRQVEFKVIDGEDETATLVAAYFEENEESWRFLLFEPPFSQAYNLERSRVVEDERLFDEQLMDLKSAQKWFNTIYGRFARSLAELDSVSYKQPSTPIEMTVTGSGWRGEIRSQYTRCMLEIPSQQLPRCEGLPALNTGTPTGPLSTAFGRQ
jgi:hypothetical protein